jgi:hypothetical protein
MREIGGLIKLAGRRPMPDAAQISTAREAARAEWRRAARPRRWRRSLWSVTAAASIIGAAAVVWFSRPTSQPPAAAPRIEIATLHTITGALVVTSPDGARHTVTQSGMRLRVGDRIDVPEGRRAAVSMGGTVSVRFDSGTSAAFDEANRLRLDRGAVYVDSGTAPHGAALQVETPLGSVTHVGTQFEVRLLGESLRVRVREGAVAVARAGRRWTSPAGEALLLKGHDAPDRHAIATFGADWNWVTEVAAPFQLEGAALPRFLDWAGRELGVRWEYADPGMKRRFDQIVLHGSLRALTPDEALGAVLPTCGLTFSESDGRIIVRAR